MFPELGERNLLTSRSWLGTYCKAESFACLEDEPRQRQEELESHFSKLASDFRELKALRRCEIVELIFTHTYIIYIHIQYNI